MSSANGNGHSPRLPELQEQLALARARSELAQAQAEAQLWESTLAGMGGFGPSWSDAMNPWSYRQDDFGRTWYPLGGNLHSRQDGRNRPFSWTDFDLDRMRSLARWLATRNDLAIGALESLADYTVRTGYDYEAQPGEGLEQDKVAVTLAKMVQQVIEEFQSLNTLGEELDEEDAPEDEQYTWADRERDCVTRSVRDGEVFVRSFDQGDGLTLVRFVEPEQVREREALHNVAHGIETDPRDVERRLAYHLTYDGSDWERVPASEISHLKLNVDSCVKRGLSDFFSSGEALDQTSKLLRNMGVAGSAQAAIAWVEQFETATAAQGAAGLAARKDLNRPELQHPVSGRDLRYQRFEPGTIRLVDRGRQFLPAPTPVGASVHIQIVQACLRAVGSRWRMPEYMISGDGSNANYASTLVAGAPFVVRVECRQAVYGRFFLRILWQAIRNAAKYGRFVIQGRTFSWREVSRYVDVVPTPPQVAMGNPQQDAEIDHKDLAAGVMSLQTRRARRGLDDRKERANLQEEPPTRVQGRMTDLDPSGNPVQQQGQGGGGTPAPPGSAGGAGSIFEDLAEGCVPNRSGQGHHDDQTGRPCTHGGTGGGGNPHQGAPAADPSPGPSASQQGARVNEQALDAELARAAPEAMNDPRQAGKVKGFARALAKRAAGYGRELVNLAVQYGPDLLETAEDLQKLSAAKAADSLRGTTGIATNVLLNVTGVVLSHAIVWAKKKLHERSQPKTESAQQGDGKAQLQALIDRMFADVAADLGGQQQQNEDCGGRCGEGCPCRECVELREARGADEDVDALAIAELFYGLYGKKALEIIRGLAGIKESQRALWRLLDLAEGWNAADHPRGKNGRFIPKGSGEAVNAAREVVSKVIGGDTSADPKQLLDHLSILTVAQIRDLAKEHGRKIPRMLREEMVSAVMQLVKKTPANQPAAQKDTGDSDGGRPEPAGGGAGEASARPGEPVAAAAGGPADTGADQDRGAAGEPAGRGAATRVPADIGEVNRRLDRFQKLFHEKGQHHVGEWLGKLREHVNAVGGQAALDALGPAAAGKNDKGEVQYWGVGTEEANWQHMGEFMEAYLARNGIVAVTGDTSSPDSPLISALGAPDRFVAGQDFKPEGMHFKNKLDEAKTLPGLEKSEDISKVMGGPVTHLTPEVTDKLDQEYGKGQWIVKCYDDNAAAGYGIFFPQRAAAIAQDARNTIWGAGEHLARYGFELKRKDGKVVGLKHSGGDEYDFGTEKYQNTIGGDARHWADRAATAAHHEQGAMLPEGSFMVQPAFQAVGISDAERAAGKTWHEKNEGRVHLVTRPDGQVEVVPHSTWLKGGNLPVVFEDDDTRAMAQAAKAAIEKIPHEARKGQVYAPDIMKTADGYRVVELNAQGDNNGSGYLHDNHFTIDAYTSYLTGREPMHVAFIRKLLTKRGKGVKESKDASGHEHDDKGQFTSGGGGAATKTKGKKTKAPPPAVAGMAQAPAHHPGAAHGSSVRVTPVADRVFSGKPVPTQTTLTKQETGRVGEAVITAWLKHQGHADAGPMNSSQTNFPIDLIEDHAPTEAKGGLVSNSPGAQQWRLTFSKESAEEKELYEQMTPEERADWNAEKQKRIHERKEAVIRAMSEEYGVKIKPRTMTAIINPDTQTADIYSFEGFHDRIGWTSEQAKAGYVGTVRYDHPEA